MRIFLALPVFVVLWPLAIIAQSGDTLESLAASWSGLRKPVRCQPADTNWFTPSGQRVCVWRDWRVGTERWAQAEIYGQRADGAPLDLLVWAMNRASSKAVAELRDSLQRELPKRGLTHYACKSGAHRWQAAGLAVELSPGFVEPDGSVRVSVFAVTESRLLPKLACRDVPDVPSIPSKPIHKGLHVQ